MSEAQPLVIATPQAPAGALSGTRHRQGIARQRSFGLSAGGFRRGSGRPQVFRPTANHSQSACRDPSHPRRQSRKLPTDPRRRCGCCVRCSATVCCSATAKIGNISGAPWPPPLRRGRCPIVGAPCRAASRGYRRQSGGASRAARRSSRRDAVSCLGDRRTSMFSLAMERYRPELRDLITRYTERSRPANPARFSAASGDPEPTRFRPPTGSTAMDGSDRPDHRRAPGEGLVSGSE